MSAEKLLDVTSIQDEDTLRKMWQGTEDFGRKKEIRSHMYKLREARLRDFYTTGEVSTDIQSSHHSSSKTTGNMKDLDMSKHADSLGDHSFLSLKSKEVRDSESPNRDVHFNVTDRKANDGWTVQTSKERSEDGKTHTTKRLATISGTQKIDGGVEKYAAKNEQKASVFQDGDDKNFTKTVSAGSKSVIQQEAVGGDENSNFRATSSSTSTSSRVVTEHKSSSEGAVPTGTQDSIVRKTFTTNVPEEFRNHPSYVDGNTKVYTETKTLPDGSKVTTTKYETKGGKTFSTQEQRSSTHQSSQQQQSSSSEQRTSSNYQLRTGADDVDFNKSRMIEYVVPSENARNESVTTTRSTVQGGKCVENVQQNQSAQSKQNITRTTREEVTHYPEEIREIRLTNQQGSKGLKKEITKVVQEEVIVHPTQEIHVTHDVRHVDNRQSVSKRDQHVHHTHTDTVREKEQVLLEPRETRQVVVQKTNIPQSSEVTVTKTTTVSQGGKVDNYNQKTVSDSFINVEKQHLKDTQVTHTDDKQFVQTTQTPRRESVPATPRESVPSTPGEFKPTAPKESVPSTPKEFVPSTPVDSPRKVPRQEVDHYDLPERRQPIHPPKSEMDTTSKPTEGQYDTTYRTDYTPKRISVEVSPTHDAFARSLRAITPDRDTKSPRGSTRSLRTSSSSLRSSTSPEKHPHRQPTPDKRKSPSKFTNTYEPSSTYPRFSPEKQRPVNGFDRRPSPQKKSPSRNESTTTIVTVKTRKSNDFPRSRSTSPTSTASDIEFVKTTDLDVVEDTVRTTKNVASRRHTDSIITETRPSSLDILTTTRKTKKITDRSPTSPLTSPKKREPSPIKDPTRKSSLRTSKVEREEKLKTFKRTDTYEERCRQILGIPDKKTVEKNITDILITDRKSAQRPRKPETPKSKETSPDFPQKSTTTKSTTSSFLNKERIDTSLRRTSPEKKQPIISEFPSQIRKSPEKEAIQPYPARSSPEKFRSTIAEFPSQIRRSPEREPLGPYPEKEQPSKYHPNISEFPSQIKRSPEKEPLGPYPEKEKPNKYQPGVAEFPSQIRRSPEKELLEPYPEKERPKKFQPGVAEFPSQITRSPEKEPLEPYPEKERPKKFQPGVAEFPSQIRRSPEKEHLEPYLEKEKPKKFQPGVAEFPSQIRRSPEREPLGPYPEKERPNKYQPSVSEFPSQIRRSPEKEVLGPYPERKSPERYVPSSINEFPSQTRKSPVNDYGNETKLMKETATYLESTVPVVEPVCTKKFISTLGEDEEEERKTLVVQKERLSPIRGIPDSPNKTVKKDSPDRTTTPKTKDVKLTQVTSKIRRIPEQTIKKKESRFETEYVDKYGKCKKSPTVPADKTKKITLMDIEKMNEHMVDKATHIRTHRVDDVYTNKRTVTTSKPVYKVEEKPKKTDAFKPKKPETFTRKPLEKDVPKRPTSTLTPEKKPLKTKPGSPDRFTKLIENDKNIYNTRRIETRTATIKSRVPDVTTPKHHVVSTIINVNPKPKTDLNTKTKTVHTTIKTTRIGQVRPSTVDKSNKPKPKLQNGFKHPDSGEDSEEDQITRRMEKNTRMTSDQVVKPRKTTPTRGFPKSEFVSSDTKQKKCVSTKSIVINSNVADEREIIVDLQRSKSSREPTPDKICPRPVSSDEDTGAYPRYPDKIVEPDDGSLRRKPKKLADLPIIENETFDETRCKRIITEVDKVQEADESLLSVTDKVNRFTNITETVTKTEGIAPKVPRPSLSVDQDLISDECMLSVSDKVSKFITTAEKLTVNQPDRPKSPRCQYVKKETDLDDDTSRLTEKISQFAPKAEPTKKPVVPKVPRPDFKNVDEKLQSDVCLLSVSDKVNKFITTAEKLSTDFKPAINTGTYKKEKSPTRTRSPDSPRRLSPQKDVTTECVTIEDEDHLFTRRTSTTSPTRRSPDKNLSSPPIGLETTPKSSRRSSQEDKTVINTTSRLRSTESIKKARALFENITKSPESPRQKDILSRPSVFEARKPKPNDRSTSPKRDFKIEDVNYGTYRKSDRTRSKLDYSSDEEIATTTTRTRTSKKDDIVFHKFKPSDLTSGDESAPRSREPSVEKEVPGYMKPLDRTLRANSPHLENLSKMSETVAKSTTSIEEQLEPRVTKFGVTLRRTDSGNAITTSTTTTTSSIDRKRSSSILDKLKIDKEIEEIYDLELLEELLERTVDYEIRRRIRAQIRIVKRLISENKLETVVVTTRTERRGKSPEKRIVTSKMNDQTEYQTKYTRKPLSPTRSVDNKLYKHSNLVDKMDANKKSTEYQTSYTYQERRSSSDVKTTRERTPSPARKPSPEWKETPKRKPSPERKSNIEKKSSPGRKPSHEWKPSTDWKSNLERKPSPERKSYPERRSSTEWKSSFEQKSSSFDQKSSFERKSSFESRTSPERRPKSSPERKSTKRVTISPEPPTIEGSEPRSVFKTDLKRLPTMPVGSKTPKDDKPEWVTKRNLRKVTDKSPYKTKTTTTTTTKKESVRSFSPSKEKTDVITSSYGVGPLDENGSPLFGLKALRAQNKADSTSTKVQGTIVRSQYYSEDGREPVGEVSVTKYSTDPNDLRENGKGLASVTTTQKFGYKGTPSLKTITTNTKKRLSNDDEDELLSTSTNRTVTQVTRRGSVKEMSQKFIENAVETLKSEKQGSYPKAGLILRTSSFKDSKERHSGSSSSRECSPELQEVRRTVTSTSRSGDTFLSNKSRVSGVQDVITRMKNTEEYEEGLTQEDVEAKNLLNKFLGSQVILHGMESHPMRSSGGSVMATSSSSSTSASKRSTKISTTITEGGKQRTIVRVFEHPLTVDQLDLVHDEETLKLLLEQSTDYEERRLIRSRLRQVMAEQEAGVVDADSESLLLPLLQGLLDAPENSEQTPDSGTESGEDLRGGLIAEVQSALDKLSNSLRGGESVEMSNEKRDSLLQLVTRLQAGLSTQTATNTGNVFERRHSQGRFSRRRQRPNRHTVGVTSEELEDARRLMEEIALRDRVPKLLPLTKQNSEGAVIGKCAFNPGKYSPKSPVKNAVAKPFSSSTSTSLSGASSTVETPTECLEAFFNIPEKPTSETRKPSFKKSLSMDEPGNFDYVDIKSAHHAAVQAAAQKQHEKQSSKPTTPTTIITSPVLSNYSAEKKSFPVNGKLKSDVSGSETDEDPSTLKAPIIHQTTYEEQDELPEEPPLVLETNPLYKSERPQRTADKYSRFNSDKKLKMKRANTIDIPKPIHFYDDDDEDDDAEEIDIDRNARRNTYYALRGPIRVGTPNRNNTVPTFEPKTESDHKFLAFINKHNNDTSNANSKTQKGSLWGNAAQNQGTNWTRKFGNIKTAFEKASESETKPSVSVVSSARNFWKSADDAVTAGRISSVGPKISKQSARNLQQMYEEKQKEAQKPPWLEEKNVVTGTLKVDTKGFDVNKNYRVVSQPSVNKFSHAPMSPFKPIAKSHYNDTENKSSLLVANNVLKATINDQSNPDTPLYLYSPKPLLSSPNDSLDSSPMSPNTPLPTPKSLKAHNESRVLSIAASKFENTPTPTEPVRPRRASKDQQHKVNIPTTLQQQQLPSGHLEGKITAPYISKTVGSKTVRKLSDQYDHMGAQIPQTTSNKYLPSFTNPITKQTFAPAPAKTNVLQNSNCSAFAQYNPRHSNAQNYPEPNVTYAVYPEPSVVYTNYPNKTTNYKNQPLQQQYQPQSQQQYQIPPYKPQQQYQPQQPQQQHQLQQQYQSNQQYEPQQYQQQHYQPHPKYESQHKYPQQQYQSHQQYQAQPHYPMQPPYQTKQHYQTQEQYQPEQQYKQQLYHEAQQQMQTKPEYQSHYHPKIPEQQYQSRSNHEHGQQNYPYIDGGRYQKTNNYTSPPQPQQPGYNYSAQGSNKPQTNGHVSNKPKPSYKQLPDVSQHHQEPYTVYNNVAAKKPEKVKDAQRSNSIKEQMKVYESGNTAPNVHPPKLQTQVSNESVKEYNAVSSRVMTGPVSQQAVTVAQNKPKSRNEHDMDAAFNLRNSLQTIGNSNSNTKGKTNAISNTKQPDHQQQKHQQQDHQHQKHQQQEHQHQKHQQHQKQQSKMPNFCVNDKPVNLQSLEINDKGESVVTSKFHIPVKTIEVPRRSSPAALSKCDSWHQIVHEQQKVASKPSPRGSPNSRTVVRSKSSHTLQLPKQFEAGMSRDEMQVKKKTVEAYFGTTKTSNTTSSTSTSTSTSASSKSKSSINRVKTSEKLSSTGKTETIAKKSEGSVTTTTQQVSSRMSSQQISKKPLSPFAKFKQLDKQNSLNTPPSTPKTPTGSGALFKFTDPNLNRSANTIKERLLQWCQMKTKEYENIQLDNFSSSWADGLAFCALIHHFLPEAFDYHALSPKNRRYNFTLAFQVADEKAGIAPLLDVDDMVEFRKPDWKCVFTYVQTIYRRFKDED